MPGKKTCKMSPLIGESEGEVLPGHYGFLSETCNDAIFFDRFVEANIQTTAEIMVCPAGPGLTLAEDA